MFARVFGNYVVLPIFLTLLVPLVVSADGKPFAPESIDGVVIVTAEEAIELILDNPDMPIIDSRKKTEYVKGHIEGRSACSIRR